MIGLRSILPNDLAATPQRRARVARRGVADVEVRWPASPGVSRTMKKSSTRKTARIAAGTKNTHQVGAALAMSVAPVVGEVEAERDEDAEDAAERAALAHVEPRRVHLDDRDRAEALEVHVHARRAPTASPPGRPAASSRCSSTAVHHRRPSARCTPPSPPRTGGSSCGPPSLSVSGPLSRKETPYVERAPEEDGAEVLVRRCARPARSWPR